MIEVLEDNRKIWPALLVKVKEGFLGLKGSAVIQVENTVRAFRAKGAVRVRVYKKLKCSGHLSMTGTQSRFSLRR